jgi:hypothetical protein
VHIEQVKKYVLSSLVCSVVMLHSAAIAALGVVSNGAGGSRQGLFVLSVLFGAFAITAVRLINGLRVLTPWLLCALVIPTLVYWLWFGPFGH